MRIALPTLCLLSMTTAAMPHESRMKVLTQFEAPTTCAGPS